MSENSNGCFKNWEVLLSLYWYRSACIGWAVISSQLCLELTILNRCNCRHKAQPIDLTSSHRLCIWACVPMSRHLFFYVCQGFSLQIGFRSNFKRDHVQKRINPTTIISCSISALHNFWAKAKMTNYYFLGYHQHFPGKCSQFTALSFYRCALICFFKSLSGSDKTAAFLHSLFSCL